MLQAKLAKLRRELLEPSTGAGAGGGKGEGQCSTKECQARHFIVAYTMYLALIGMCFITVISYITLTTTCVSMHNLQTCPQQMRVVHE